MVAREPSRSPPDESEINRLSPSTKLPGSSPKEREAIEAQSRPNAALIHETIRAEGISELERPASALFISGIAGGLSMGFSLLVEGLLEAHIPDTSWRPLLSKLGYTIGFLIVVLGRQQLFTENTLTPILPLLHNRDARTLVDVLRLWSLVLIANITGTAAIAAVLVHASIFDPEVHMAFERISQPALAGAFGETTLRAIFAGWLIALMVWLLPAAENARPTIIIIVTYVISLGGFTHIIAGSVDAFYLVQTGAIDLADYLTRFFVPTLLGNVIGGVSLVAALNYGQVASEIQE
jgi:formate/nitrite transporter FocA (FNT family)